MIFFRKIFYIVTFFFLLLIVKIAYTLDIDDFVFYNKVRTIYHKNFPNTLIADVYSPFFRKILEKIPKDYYCIRKKKIQIKYLFIKNDLEMMFVENVKNPFVNRFQMYLDFYRSAKEFLEIFNSYKEFSKIYHWNYIKTKNNLHIVKMRKRVRVNYYFYLFFDKNFFLKKIEYKDYHGILGKVFLNYTKIKQFLFLKKIIIKKRNKKTKKWNTIRIYLKNLKTNFQIMENKILNLQEGCKTIKDIVINS